MPLSYALLVGVLFAVGVYLLMRRSVVDLVFGLLILTHAANLLVFASGGLARGAAPIAGDLAEMADPLPQALVLTAIVIGLGIAAFAVVLVARLYDATGQEELPDRDDGDDPDPEEERE